MKLLRFFFAFSLAIVISACSGYDDSELVKRIEDLEAKVKTLQQQVSGMNQDITALRTTLDAIANEDVVVGIRAIEDSGKAGWEITYRKGGVVRIFPSEGTESKIGVAEVGGVLYWTWGGSFLLDPAGKRIPAAGKNGSDGQDGITPLVKIENDYWWVSYDEGATWTRLEKASSGSSGGGDSMFRSVSVVDGNLVLVLNNGTKLTIPITSIEKPTAFDENSIVFSVAALSDVHIGNGYNSEAKFTSALNQLKNRAAEKDSDGLDAVMIAGDIINTTNTGQISTLKQLYEAVFDPVKVPLIYTVGNHDMNPGCNWSTNTVTQNAVFHDILGDNYFLTDQDQTMRKNFECRHCVVGNYHIIGITPNNANPVLYDANSTLWLDNVLEQITTAEPEKYVLLITHPMIYNTVYGSTLGTYWYTSTLTDILNKYPQVVTFSGHLHFPLNDPRSVWQGNFTSMGCASCSYMAFEGGNYENKSSNTVLNDAGDYSQGLLVQFDANGFMRATRMDFFHSTVIGKAWEMAPPASDRSHLDTYNHTALRAANAAPTLSTLEVECGDVNNGVAPVTARWAAGTDDEFVHHYGYTLRKGGSILVSKLIMSDFYRCPQTSMMKSEYVFSLGNLEEGDYSLEIKAYDSWDAQSDPLVKDFSVGGDYETVMTTDAAGSMSFSAGSGSITGSWLRYNSGELSWDANTTGKPRSEVLSLPNNSKVKVIQVEPKDFKGTWSFRSQRFSNNSSVASASADLTYDITIGDAKYGETLQDVGGKSITNNLGFNGLYKDAVADVALSIDYSLRLVKFGLFLDGRRAQAVSNGNSTYPYVCFLPELGGSSSAVEAPYTFVPVPLGTDNNYTWLWFSVSSDFDVLNYDYPFQRLNTTNPHTTSPYIIGITCAVCKNASPAASDFKEQYDVIYQANPNKAMTNGGFTLTRK